MFSVSAAQFCGWPARRRRLRFGCCSCEFASNAVKSNTYTHTHKQTDDRLCHSISSQTNGTTSERMHRNIKSDCMRASKSNPYIVCVCAHFSSTEHTYMCPLVLAPIRIVIIFLYQHMLNNPPHTSLQNHHPEPTTGSTNSTNSTSSTCTKIKRTSACVCVPPSCAREL